MTALTVPPTAVDRLCGRPVRQSSPPFTRIPRTFDRYSKAETDVLLPAIIQPLLTSILLSSPDILSTKQTAGIVVALLDLNDLEIVDEKVEIHSLPPSPLGNYLPDFIIREASAYIDNLETDPIPHDACASAFSPPLMVQAPYRIRIPESEDDGVSMTRVDNTPSGPMVRQAPFFTSKGSGPQSMTLSIQLRSKCKICITEDFCILSLQVGLAVQLHNRAHLPDAVALDCRHGLCYTFERYLLFLGV